MVLRLIELNNEEYIDNVPYRNGQLIYCRDTLSTYADTPDGSRTSVDLVIKVDTLPTTDINTKKIYFCTEDNELYRYDGTEFLPITDLTEMFDLISEQEDVYSMYLRYHGRVVSPIVSSETVLRPSGEQAEDSFLLIENEIKRLLNPYERQIIPSKDNQKVFILPLPYVSYLIEGNQFSLYINNVLQFNTIDYTVDIKNATVTLNTGVPLNTDIRVIFHYMNSALDVIQEIFVTTDKSQVEFTLTKSTYYVGKGMTSLYVNGIKQPNEAYTELTDHSFKLNGEVPKGTMIIFEIGKLLPRVETE